MNYTNNVLLFTNNNCSLVLNLKDICKNVKLTLTVEKNLYNLFNILIKFKPRYIFFDVTDINIRNFPFEMLNHQVFKDETKIIILDESFISKNSLVDYVNIENLENYILHNEFYLNKVKNVNINKSDVSSVLINLNFNPSHKGKEFLTECISLVIEDKLFYGCLNKNCYPLVASAFCTEVVNIDRDIRSAIKKAYLNRNEYWDKFFNTTFSKRPSCRNFIFLFVERIINLYNNQQ